ncbi:MAG TPA: hypothetical protein VM070_07405 [Candidatus Saccharimonadales bacterium]|nr:hypothetical protein [Candidatus Saccharimonadales bacterium]
MVMTASERAGDLEQLTEGAALLSRAGNRVAALAVLWAAVAIAPTDQIAHRRLAATLAGGGDLEGAAQEYVRYIEFLLPLGELTRVTAELHYAATTLGAVPALEGATRAVAQKLPELLDQQRAITSGGEGVRSVPDGTLTPAHQVVAQAPAAPPAPDAQTVVPFPSARAGVRIAFSVCLHEDAETAWLQLEGGTADLRPSAVRLLDDDVVIETRRCLAMPPGRAGHARPAGTEPGAVWVVLAAPPAMLRAIDRGEGDRYRVEAQVGEEWLDTELTDTGCRFGTGSGADRAARSA